MGKVKTLDDLKNLREKLKKDADAGYSGSESEDIIRIKVAMATCCIASGSRETMNYISNEMEKRNIEAIVTQTGCMGYCYAEPTVEVKIPGMEALVFGYVDEKKADEIIERYIRNGELVEGIIPMNYQDIKAEDNI